MQTGFTSETSIHLMQVLLGQEVHERGESPHDARLPAVSRQIGKVHDPQVTSDAIVNDIVMIEFSEQALRLYD